jgi:hypothetical protein
MVIVDGNETCTRVPSPIIKYSEVHLKAKRELKTPYTNITETVHRFTTKKERFLLSVSGRCRYGG